jgi:hypothetical protein
MGIGDVRFTVLEIVNEVQRALSLTQTSLTANKLATQMVDFINDVCDELSDYGNWQEMLISGNVTAVSGQSDYSINTSANVKNIGDIFFAPRSGPLRNITIREMRIRTRTTIVGTPSQFTVYGTDANGNPVIRVTPIPTQNEDGELFSLVYYIKAPLYTTSNASSVVPFPGQIMVKGVLAKALLNESGGAVTDHYTKTQQEYLSARKEALNRFNGDTGWQINFSPSIIGRRR